MPEFMMGYGSKQGAELFDALDKFTKGYIEAMFFTSTGTSDDGDLQNASFDQLHSLTLNAIISSCKDFQEKYAALLAGAYAKDYTEDMAGRDYWFTRNGHGVGFWDRGLGSVGKMLTTVSEYSEVSLYRGDDGLLYLFDG